MKIPILLTIVASASLAVGETLKLKQLDENGSAVINATVRISFISPQTYKWVNLEPVSDMTGKVVAEIDRKQGFFIRIKHPGFYDTDFGTLSSESDLNKTVIMRRVSNPVPLLVKRFNIGSGRALKIPIQDEWLGHDFEVGDWVAPYGKGKTTDMRFKFENQFKGWKSSDEKIKKSRLHPVNRELTEEEFRIHYGKWDAELEISFPSQKEGLVKEKERFLPYCRLRMPHEAPVEGYQSTWRYTANNYSPSTVREDVGFFLRTRIKLDESGKIVSANYSKIIGDIRLVPTGGLLLYYYFNPRPNDRNLEFDPDRNLFPHDPHGARLENDP